MLFSRTVPLTLGAWVAWSLPLSAQDRPRRIQFTGDVGLVDASGNSSVTTVNVGDKLLIQTADKKAIFSETFGLVYGRSEGLVNASNWRAGTRLDYGLGTRLYLFGLLGLDRNRFADQPLITYHDGTQTFFALQIQPKLPDALALPVDYLVMIDTSASKGKAVNMPDGSASHVLEWPPDSFVPIRYPSRQP